MFCLLFLSRICEEFKNIQERSLREPETSEDLIDMIAFVEKARTSGMVQLNDRITQSKDRLAYLIDVFLFTPEDIDLNCEVLTWPTRINPVFDKNEEVCSILFCISKIDCATVISVSLCNNTKKKLAPVHYYIRALRFPPTRRPSECKHRCQLAWCK